MAAGRGAVLALVAAAFPTAHACSDALGCSLNGDCVSGRCTCAPQWEGTACERLRFSDPMDWATGYKVEANASWGGNSVYHDGMYHMFVAHMMNGCGLDDYGTNSAIARVTSKNVNGPFEFQEIAIPAYAHNPTVRALPDGSGYVLYFIGGSRSVPKDCANVSASAPPVDPRVHFVSGAVPNGTVGSDISVAYASSVYGPWAVKQVLFDAASAAGTKYLQGGFTNPSPHFRPDGSVTLALQGGKIGGHWEMIGVARAAAWDGVFSILTAEPVIPFVPVVCIAGMGEDPFLWEDARGWHILIHGMCPSGFINAVHAYSNDDCKTWHVNLIPPYSYLVPTTRGEHFFWRVERPQLAFARYDNATGHAEAPLALYNGVCDSPTCLLTPGAKRLDWRTWTTARLINQA
eukprot:TRINITY_DN20832_c0_g1_i1.p1 TRINITY_DN20832_c0_g1~~TRINITY_DN20832_c0_g1_i1.p1  ORF type:complete len:404 (+),score=99.47 TRINITY_DN20832_c0_g1_i1:54-1265(+)